MKRLRRQFKLGPRQTVGEGEGTDDGHDLPCSSGTVTNRRQGMENTLQISGISKERSFKPPYIPECEVFQVGGPEADEKLKRCERSCHERFIPVKKFTKKDLPKGCRDKETWKGFEQLCSRTVKLDVKYTSVSRPDTHPDSKVTYPYADYRGPEFKGIIRTGTGFIIPYSKSSRVEHTNCTCPECQELGKAKSTFFRVIVFTAAHVVFDDSEAEKTVCEVFYDDPKKKNNVKKLYGVKQVDMENLRGGGVLGRMISNMFEVNDLGSTKKRPELDMFAMECISHDMNLYKDLEPVLNESNFYFPDIPVIVSHPHGCSKMVGKGQFRKLRFQLPETHTQETSYTVPVGTRVVTETCFPDFLEKDPNIDTEYRTTKSLYVYIPCDTNKTATISRKEGSANRYFFPEDSKCYVDRTTEIPIEDFSFYACELFRIIDHSEISYDIVYDMHTCYGSSGAWVPTKGGFLNPFLCHFGKSPDTNGCLNQTGKYTPFW